MSVEIPHLAFPFRMVSDGGVVRAAVVEQDSDEEIEACAEIVLRYPVDYREELPGFGVPDQAFRKGGPDVATLTAAVERWEPRVEALGESVLEDMIARVVIELAPEAT